MSSVALSLLQVALVHVSRIPRSEINLPVPGMARHLVYGLHSAHCGSDWWWRRALLHRSCQHGPPSKTMFASTGSHDDLQRSCEFTCSHPAWPDSRAISRGRSSNICSFLDGWLSFVQTCPAAQLLPAGGRSLAVWQQLQLASSRQACFRTTCGN
jgi:hypothetical protein